MNAWDSRDSLKIGENHGDPGWGGSSKVYYFLKKWMSSTAFFLDVVSLPKNFNMEPEKWVVLGKRSFSFLKKKYHLQEKVSNCMKLSLPNKIEVSESVGFDYHQSLNSSWIFVFFSKQGRMNRDEYRNDVRVHTVEHINNVPLEETKNIFLFGGVFRSSVL